MVGSRAEEKQRRAKTMSEQSWRTTRVMKATMKVISSLAVILAETKLAGIWHMLGQQAGGRVGTGRKD